MYRAANRWVALIGLVVFLSFTALVLPGQANSAEELGGNAGSPDLSFYYSSEDLYKWAEAYGAQGRVAYVRARFSFDLVWPLVYTFFLISAISWVYGRAVEPGSVWRFANLAPLVAMAFDYLENLSTSVVMWRYPDQTPVVDRLAPLFTLVKWIFVNGSFVLLFAGVMVVIGLWIKRLTRK